MGKRANICGLPGVTQTGEMVYEIWKYFSKEVREEVIRTEWEGNRSSDFYCPLGKALRIERIRKEGVAPSVYLAPPGSVIANYFCKEYQSSEWEVIKEEAWEFIDDWEGGDILPSQLKEAMGVD